MTSADPDLANDSVVGNGRLPFPEANPLAFWIGLTIVILSLVSGLATYLILTGLTPIVPRNDIVLAVLLINVVLIVAMIAVIGWQAIGLAKAWRDKEAGARLHIRIVGLFSIIAALPAILLAIGATTTFSRSLDSWFTSRTREIIANSLDVANAYLEEHGQVIRTDIVNMPRTSTMRPIRSATIPSSSVARCSPMRACVICRQPMSSMRRAVRSSAPSRTSGCPISRRRLR